jgi:anti-sigma factor RsiW
MTDVMELSCRELVELVTDYLEGALGDAERRRFEAHIAKCNGCTRYLAQLRETIRLTGTLTPSDLSPEVEKTLLQAFRDWRNGS